MIINTNTSVCNQWYRFTTHLQTRNFRLVVHTVLSNVEKIIASDCVPHFAIHRHAIFYQYSCSKCKYVFTLILLYTLEREYLTNRVISQQQNVSRCTSAKRYRSTYISDQCALNFLKKRGEKIRTSSRRQDGTTHLITTIDELKNRRRIYTGAR